jgi:hypothetical protein
MRSTCGPNAPRPAVATVRKPAPAFTAEAVVNGEFKTVSLSDYAGTRLCVDEAAGGLRHAWACRPSPHMPLYLFVVRSLHGVLEAASPNLPSLLLCCCPCLSGKYVVLFFYPLDFTFVCPTEICQFSTCLLPSTATSWPTFFSPPQLSVS